MSDSLSPPAARPLTPTRPGALSYLRKLASSPKLEDDREAFSTPLSGLCASSSTPASAASFENYTDLPVELQTYIAAFLTCRDVLSLASCCATMRLDSRSDAIWAELYRRAGYPSLASQR